MGDSARNGLVLCVFIALLGASGENDAPSYLGSNSCRECHQTERLGDQMTPWGKSKHAHAHETLLTPKAKEVALAKGIESAPESTPECLRCHTTGYDVADKKYPKNITVEEGIGCEACHGPASLHKRDGQILMDEPDKAAGIKGDRHLAKTNADTCIRCHNPESPTWNIERYKTGSNQASGFDFKQAMKLIRHPASVEH